MITRIAYLNPTLIFGISILLLFCIPTTPFYIKITIINFWTNTRCSLCSYKPKNYRPNSSPQDLVIGFFSSGKPGLYYFARSLRTTGCLATVVFITTNEAYKYFRSIQRPLLYCDITILLISEEEQKLANKNVSWHTIARIVIAAYLQNHQQEFERALYIDLFDVVFQGDPFTEDIGENTLVFSPEPMLIREETICAMPWLHKTYRENLYKHPIEYYYNMSIICSGIVIGGIKPMAILYNQINKNLCIHGPEPVDQSVLEMLVYDGFCDDHHFNCTINQTSWKDSHYASWAIYWLLNNRTDYRVGQLKHPESNVYPLVLHHINRHPKISSYVESVVCKGT